MNEEFNMQERVNELEQRVAYLEKLVASRAIEQLVNSANLAMLESLYRGTATPVAVRSGKAAMEEHSKWAFQQINAGENPSEVYNVYFAAVWENASLKPFLS